MVSRTYSQAAALARLAARWPGIPGRLPPLIAMTDPDRTPDICAFANALPDGCAIIYRHFGRDERYSVAGELAEIARRKALILLITADPALAEACDADGVHWPASQARQARQWRRQTAAIMTISAHNRRELALAAMSGADAALLSPVFATQSHVGATGLGTLKSAALIREARLPVYALGGVNAGTAKRLARSGFSGLAAIDGMKP